LHHKHFIHTFHFIKSLLETNTIKEKRERKEKTTEPPPLPQASAPNPISAAAANLGGHALRRISNLPTSL